MNSQKETSNEFKYKNTFIEYLFSVKNEDKYKVLRVLGFKFKFKRKTTRFDRLYLYNLKYEIMDEISKMSSNPVLPKIMTIDETLDFVIKNKKSVCRFGDAEFYSLLDIPGTSYYNQKSSKELTLKLRETLLTDNPNVLVCLWDFFGSLEPYNEYHRNIARQHMVPLRSKINELIDFNKTYGNAFITRFYINLNDKSKAGARFKKMKELWDKRGVVIIEGAGTRLGVGNDLFDNAAQIQRVLCPAESAFDKYEEIFNYAKTLPKDKLVLISLGMTATALAFELAKLGFWAIDIGHIDIEYEWFLMKAELPAFISKNKYVQETGQKDIVDINDEKYNSQIIKKIL